MVTFSVPRRSYPQNLSAVVVIVTVLVAVAREGVKFGSVAELTHIDDARDKESFPRTMWVGGFFAGRFFPELVLEGKSAKYSEQFQLLTGR